MGRKSRSKSQPRQPSAAPVDATLAGSRAGEAARSGFVARSLAPAAAAAVLLLVIATVWVTPRGGSDTYMALAGGRDVFNGKLAKPDDWAFTTSGKIWLNQNWGFDVLAYATMRAAGESGLLALKALFLLAIASMAVLAARARGARLPSALLVTALAMAGSRWYLDIRPNLATHALGCLLLLILYRCRTRPRLVWLAVPLIAVWANVHGGFTLGVAVVGVWLAAGAASALYTDGLRRAIRGCVAPAGAIVASVALAAVTSPFGLRNITYPFTYVSSPQWRTVSEWQPPSLAAQGGWKSARELFLFVAFIGAVTAWRTLAGRRSRTADVAHADALPALWLFDAGLAITLAWMGFSSIRFISVAMILLVPLAARQADGFLGGSRPWVTTLAAGGLAAAVLPFARMVVVPYGASNPRFTSETFLQRMMCTDQLPSGAADFLADNEVAGRVLNRWEWESYLRWRRPELKLFIGGRANQIYGLETLETYRRFGTNAAPAATLKELDTHLAVVSLENVFLQMVDRLVFEPGAHWAPVFYDGLSIVLADLDEVAARDLAERVVSGRARFRDARVAAMSRALGRVSSVGAAIDAQALSDLLAANRDFPTPGGPWFLFFTARANRVQSVRIARMLETEYDLLTAEGGRRDGRLRRLQARLSCAQILANLHGRDAQAAGWISTREELLSELRELIADS